MISGVIWVQLPEHLCLPVSLPFEDYLKQWSAMMMESSVMPHFSKSCGNSQVKGNEILLALPGREILISLSPIRHQRTHTGQCVLERWQYVLCPHMVISFVVKLAAEIWYLCPIQSTVRFPDLCSKAVFIKKKTILAAAMQMSHFTSKTISPTKSFFFFFLAGFQSMAWVSMPPVPPPHSTETDTANFCLRPALAKEPTRRETACALISKIFMSCFG